MKASKLYFIIMAVPAILSVISCKKSLLDPVPESVLTSKQAFNSAKDLELAVLGIYSVLQSRVQTDYELMEAPSGNAFGFYFANSPGLDEISILSVSPSNDKLNQFWKMNYNGIHRANTVLGNIDIPDNYGPTQKEQFEGEAKFLRAEFYFDLVRIFGGVPKITEPVEINEARNIPRTTVEDIYNLIIEDLEDAVNKLSSPLNIEHGRASKGAAIALLSKVYVYLKDWENAKKYLERLFSGEFSYELLTHYEDLFNESSENNNESIFSIPFVAGQNGQSLTIALTPLAGIYQAVRNGSNVVRPSWNLRKAFEEDDSRLPVTIKDELFPWAYRQGDDPVWFPYFNKWTTVVTGNDAGLDIPLLRLADFTLLYAETLYHLGDIENALKEINKVRSRAFGDDSYNYTLAEISSETSFYDKLLLERRLELAMENNRWFDLVRTGRFVNDLQNVEGEYSPITAATGEGVTVIPMHAKEYMKYFPIPLEQIQLAAPGVLQQNDGYN